MTRKYCRILKNGHFSADNKAHKHLLSLVGTELADDNVLANPKWKGKGRASDMVHHMDVFN